MKAKRAEKFEAGAVRVAVEAQVFMTSPHLIALGTIKAKLDIEIMLGSGAQARDARACIAGIVATIHELLPEKQFQQIMVQWEIDSFHLAEMLTLAQVKTTSEIDV